MTFFYGKGTKVIFVGDEGDNATARELSKSLEYLTVGEIYTVKKYNMAVWSSTLELEEFPDKYFSVNVFKLKR